MRYRRYASVYNNTPSSWRSEAALETTCWLVLAVLNTPMCFSRVSIWSAVAQVNGPNNELSASVARIELSAVWGTSNHSSPVVESYVINPSLAASQSRSEIWLIAVADTQDDTIDNIMASMYCFHFFIVVCSQMCWAHRTVGVDTSL